MRTAPAVVVRRLAAACILAVTCVFEAGAVALGADEDDPAAADAARRAFVEIVAPRATYFVQEPVRLRLRVGFDAAYFRTNVVATYRREMDVPIHVRTPWFRELPGTLPLPAPAPDPSRRRLSFALDETVTAALRAEDLVRDGRTWTVVEIERDVLPTTPGELTVPAPRLRFSYGTRFDDDLVNGRVATDRREVGVEGAPLTLHVLPLPAEGRPPEFSGAVGRFSAEATSGARDVEAGQSLKLVLRIEGEGNLAFFDAPRLDGLAGFHVYGAIDDRDAARAAGASRRTITYDIAPLGADVTAVPAITLAYFDPHPPAGYRTVRTQPIPLTVRPRSGDASDPRSVAGGEDPRGPGADDRRGPLPAIAVAVALAALLAAGAFVLVRRSSARRAATPARERALGAAAAYRVRAAMPGAEPADVFAEFLAAHLGCSTASVISPDLPAKLVAAGVPPDRAARAGAILERLVAARYGGGTPADATPELVAALVEAVDVSFREAAGGG